MVFVPTQQYFFAVFRGSTPPKMACVFAIYIYRTFVQTMTDKPDVKAAVYFDQFQRKVIVEIGVFNDDDGRLNSSVRELDGEVLLVSQFTLLADTRRGRRPSFGAAEEPSIAALRMENLERALVALGIRVRSGQFQANMDVTLVNWGPVTIVIDSKEKEQPRRQKTSNFSDGVA